MKEDKPIGRGKLTFDWIPNNAERLLDIGCASGEHTLYYLKKCSKVFGVDANKDLIETANERYPQIKFRVANAESLPFAKNYFDVVVMNDVLEHVEDEKKSLDETHRVLKKDGILIVTTPHKGLFSFIDVDNYSWYFRKLFGIKTIKPGYNRKHRHYSLKDFELLLENKFQILKSFRSSCFIVPLVSNIRLLVRHIFGENFELKVKPYLNELSELDYFIPFWKFSYNIAIIARKN